MPDWLRPSVARVGFSMAKLTFPKSVTPSCAKPFTCLPPSLGVGVSPSSLGSPFWKAASSMTSLSAAPSCASSSTSPSVCSNIKNLLTLCSSLLLKPFDFQDRIYRKTPSATGLFNPHYLTAFLFPQVSVEAREGRMRRRQVGEKFRSLQSARALELKRTLQSVV